MMSSADGSPPEGEMGTMTSIATAASALTRFRPVRLSAPAPKPVPAAPRLTTSVLVNAAFGPLGVAELTALLAGAAFEKGRVDA